jgi:hypothetical protein
MPQRGRWTGGRARTKKYTVQSVLVSIGNSFKQNNTRMVLLFSGSGAPQLPVSSPRQENIGNLPLTSGAMHAAGRAYIFE